MDMSHDLVKQTKEKPKQAFAIVKERIVTTQPSLVKGKVQQGGQCGGKLSLGGNLNSTVQYQGRRILCGVRVGINSCYKLSI